MRRLLVFVDSERPDPYLNSVVHNLKAEPIDAVTFVHVHGFPGAGAADGSSGLAKRTLAAVLQRIAALAERAEYVMPDGATVGLDERNGALSATQVMAFYAPVDGMPVNFQSREIHYGELRSFLRGVRRAAGRYVVDVTGCRKRLLGDFIALGLVDGLGEIRTLDLLVRADFAKPWTALLHEVERARPRGYEYVDILETRIMMDCSRAVVIRAPRLRYASALAVAFAVVGVALNWFFGLDSGPARWTNVLAQFATFAALFFVFFPPRSV